MVLVVTGRKQRDRDRTDALLRHAAPRRLQSASRHPPSSGRTIRLGTRRRQPIRHRSSRRRTIRHHHTIRHRSIQAQ